MPTIDPCLAGKFNIRRFQYRLKRLLIPGDAWPAGVLFRRFCSAGIPDAPDQGDSDAGSARCRWNNVFDLHHLSLTPEG